MRKGSALRSVGGRIDLRKSRLLVVDDNEHSLELMKQVLAGFRVGDVIAASNADQALELANLDTFDLMIVDCEMPAGGGVEFTNRLRANAGSPNFTTPILLVSATTPLEKVQRARDAGANMVLAKPLAPAVLLRRIEWIARNNRDFVDSGGYRGPDRRFKSGPLPEGTPERRAETLALMASPERALSQDDIDSLFG